MKYRSCTLLLLTLLLTLSHNVCAGTTVQIQDMLIIDKVECKLNQPLLFQLDSATYFSLSEKLDFKSSMFSWNLRGHVATVEIKDDKLFLKTIKTSKLYTDFNGLLDKYKDKEGRILASWISGTLICGAGECLYVAKNGFDSVYKQEIELVVENGAVVSSRTYFNRTYGTVCLDEAGYMISKGLDFSRIKAPKGRVTVRIDALNFSDEGKVTEWSIEFLRGHDDMTDDIKEQIVAEVNRVFNLIDWKTFSRDGEWHWTSQNGVLYPLIFQ